MVNTYGLVGLNGAERTLIIVDIFNTGIHQKVGNTGIHLKVDEE